MKIDEFALLPLKAEEFLGQSVAVLGIKIHKLEVLADGEAIPVFEFADIA